MKHFALLFTVMICAQGRPAAAHEQVGCLNLDENSCWHVVNKSAGLIDVQCSGYDRPKLLSKASLAQEQVYAYQFCQGWADGMGYFEPGVPILCQVATQDGRSTVIGFKLKDYGDRVALSVDDHEVTAVVRAYWSADSLVTHAAL